MASASHKDYKRLTVLGDGGVGKTALTIQLVNQHFVETYDPTIEDSYTKQCHVDGVSTLLEILDTAGQDEYTALMAQWIEEGNGYVLVYSIIDRSSFDRAKEIYEIIARYHDGDSSKIALVLVGNKCDMESKRDVPMDEAQSVAAEWKCKLIEASAKEKINVEEAFFEVVRKVRLNEGWVPDTVGGDGCKCTIL